MFFVFVSLLLNKTKDQRQFAKKFSQESIVNLKFRHTMIKYIFLSYFFPILTKCYQITHLPNYEVETEDGEIHDVDSDYYPIFDTMIKNIFKSDKINEISNNNDRRKLLGETGQ